MAIQRQCYAVPSSSVVTLAQPRFPLSYFLAFFPPLHTTSSPPWSILTTLYSRSWSWSWSSRPFHLTLFHFDFVYSPLFDSRLTCDRLSHFQQGSDHLSPSQKKANPGPTTVFSGGGRTSDSIDDQEESITTARKGKEASTMYVATQHCPVSHRPSVHDTRHTKTWISHFC